MLGVFALGISAQNLVLNPGFEDWDNTTTPSGWTKAESTEQEATEVHSGTYSAKHTGGTTDISQTIPVTPGKTYTVSLWYKVVANDGTDARIWSYWMNGTSTLADNAAELRGPDNAYLANGADWQQYSATVTAPATATDFYFEVRTYSGAVVYWDDFSFEEAPFVPAQLFFSEYIEGSSNNKALEIYNPNSEAVDLASYQIAQSSNGGGWAFYHTFPEGASIAPGDVWVIITNQTSIALFDPANADEVLAFPSVVHHNGDDARAIVYITAVDTTIQDVIGTPDVDPGTGWTVAGVTNATANHTLIRKEAIVVGATDWAVSAGTNVDDSEWIVNAQDDFSNLGKHGPDLEAPVVTFNPADAATGVSTLSNISLKFSEAIQNVGGTEITDPASLVELRETDAAGAVVAFTATINPGKTEITIVPDAKLNYNQVYYVALLANVVQDEAGNAIDALQSSTFTTSGPLQITYPAGGEVFYPGQDIHIDWIADGISNNVTLWVSFDNGATFESFLQDLDPLAGTADFTVPLDAEASLITIIRIAESGNTTFPPEEPMDDSEPFVIVPMFSIADIQGTLEANGNSSYADTICLTTGIVTYANGTNEYYISDGEGAYSAVAVRDAVNKPLVGDSIVIAGKVEEYFSLTQMNNLISYKVIASGKAVPAPAMVATGAAGEELEGVIVKLSSAKVVKAANSYGEAEVNDGSGVILTDDVYYAATLNLGGTYDITGPLSYSYAKWRVYPRSAADVVEIPSALAGVTSEKYNVDDAGGEITLIPALEELAAFKLNIVPFYGATYEVYEADGTTLASDLQTGYKLIVTSQDGNTSKTYAITKSPLSTDATVTSLVYTIDGGAGTISGVLFKSTVTTFEALLDPAAGASFMTYEADGTTLATDLASGYKLIVTAEDGSTTKTYTITLDAEMPADLIFSEYIEGTGNNKALEVFNPNDEAINLAYYQIAQISNGGDSWEYFHTFPVGTVLGSHETWVIITNETDVTMFAAENADEVLAYPSVVHHNGDDARGLVIVTGMDTTLVDIVGAIGPDPGTGWDVAGITTATLDHTLVRKGTIMEGNTDWASSAGTTADNSEWIVKDVNFFDSLGIHNLVEPEPAHVATLSALAYDGTSVQGFSPAQLTYFATLPAGTTSVSITATATDPNATVNIVPAADLSGNATARTASIEVTAEDGVTVKVYTIEFTVEVGISNGLFENVNIYPVPAVSKLYVDKAEAIHSITIYNITGTALMQVENRGMEKISIDVSSLKEGMYLMKMENAEGSAIGRFVKQ